MFPSELCVRSVLYSIRQASMILLALRHRDEPVLVQTLIAELTVEALDVRILDRFTGPDKVQAHAVFIRPRVEHLTLKLRPVVHRDR